MATVKHVQIHLTEPSRSNAAEALYPNPEPTSYEYHFDYVDRVNEAARLRNEFTGPHFHDVEECEIEEGVVHVLVGNAGYVYPLHTVARIKVYTVETPDMPPVPEPDKFTAFNDDIPF